MFHALSIDVEDWYQGLELPIENWNQYQKRVHIGMGKILEMLERYNLRATFFVLGKVAEENRGLIKKIQEAGHEIGTHGYSHQNLSQMTPKTFRSELKHSIALLEDLTGERVIGHRAAYFSITNKTLWALDILAEEGILYDSSIYPVINYRYGIPNANRLPSYINLKNSLKILEIPVSTLQLAGLNLPIGGGAYFRIYPYFFMRKCLKYFEYRQEIYNMYIHPWELDPEHPKINLSFPSSTTHYFNLNSTEFKLKCLLVNFNFSSYKNVYYKLLESMSVSD